MSIITPEWIDPHWLVVGAAPDAGAFVDEAREAYPVSITTNSGHYYFQDSLPTFYWLSCADACARYAGIAGLFHRQGAKVLTYDQDAHVLESHGFTGAIKIKLGEKSTRFDTSRWCHPKLSGLICLQIAAHHVSKDGQIVIAGMTGYKSDHHKLVVDHVNRQLGTEQGVHHTINYIAPFIQSVIDARPDVSFVFCGAPQGFDLAGPNLNIVTDAEQLHDAIRNHKQGVGVSSKMNWIEE